jgi:hypothetical protein
VKGYIWVWVLLAFGGSGLISLIGRNQGWQPLTTFLVAAGFLGGLAVVRGGLVRVMMIFLIFIQAIPAFGIRTVARVAPPLIVAGLAVMWRLYIGKLDRSRLVPRADHAVAPGAGSVIEGLKRLGFQIVGSADATGPGYDTVFTYLVSADRRTYAIAADRVQTLASAYGERVLVTTDRASMPVAPTELRQLIPDDLPGLYEAHQHALDIVGRHGARPDHISPGRVIEQSLAYEHHSLNFLTTRPWWVALQIAMGLARRQPPDSRVIVDDSESSRRIERWMNSQ